MLAVGGLAELRDAQGGPAEEIEVLVRDATDVDRRHEQVPRLHNLLIKRYLSDGRYADALRCADWSLSIWPDDWDKMALRAVALSGLGRREAALAALDAALAAQPDNAAYRQLRREIASTNACPPYVPAAPIEP